MRRILVRLGVIAGFALAAALLARALRQPRAEPAGRERTTPPPTVPPPQQRSGTPGDRGRTAAYGLDVDELRRRDGFEPVVQHLTYIQTRRGDTDRLLFVRHEDLEAMAQLEGVDTDDFLSRFDQLGVVVSSN